MNFEFVLFDFDGTIADTGRGIFAGICHALTEMAFAVPSDDELRKFIGPPIKESFRLRCSMSEEESVLAVKKYREYYSAGGMFELKVYDGIEELLVLLKNCGIKTAVASSKPIKFLNQIIGYLDFEKYFDVVAGDEIETSHKSKSEIVAEAIKRLNAKKEKTLMVGDRCFDIEGAKNSGIKSAGVLFGYGSREEFEHAGADFIVESCRELESVIGC